MKLHHRVRLALIGTSLVAAAATGQAQTTYTLTEIPTGFRDSEGLAIDQDGNAIAYAITGPALFCRPARCRALNTPKNAHFTAGNAARQFVGTQTLPGGARWAAVRTPGQGTTRIARGVAMAINAEGGVVGFTYRRGEDFYPFEPFLYKDGVTTILAPFAAGRAAAYGINDAGVVVGVSPAEYSRRRAVRWVNGVPEDLGTLSEGAESVAMTINNAGTIAGCGTISGNLDPGVVKWEDGVLVDLGKVIGDNPACATDITEGGVILGYTWAAPDAGLHTFVSEGNSLVDVNTRLSDADRAAYIITSPGGINEKGQIVATAWHKIELRHVAVRLDPVAPQSPPKLP